MTMSRIQDILARAERDGTARRTHSSPSLVPPAHDFGEPTFGPPSFDGTAALDPAPFVPTKDTSMAAAVAGAVAPAAAPAVAPIVPPVVTPTVIEGQTAHAVLHPALVAAIAPQSAVAEQYRAIRARISQHEDHAPMRTVMITSPGRGEGKSITAANLALTMAQEFQRRVALVDANLRHPSLNALFGLEDHGPGLSEVLLGQATLDDALVYLPDVGLTVLPAGAVPQFPTELLGSAGMRRTLDTLRARFDRVLLDLPAVLPLADAGTVAPLADGVVMVIRAGATQRPALDEALTALEQTKVLGVVLNDVK
jgi:capsular exopolysaccharide synthesis family protein